jgi:alpha-ketoglutarate-dependent taurine dioxygenase
LLHELRIDTAFLDPLHRRVVRPAQRLPPPPLETRMASSLDNAEETLRQQLMEYGLGLIRFEHVIDNAGFVDLGRRFGGLVIESAPDVQPFVDEGVILHLRQTKLSGRVEDAPFESRELLLHTEGSRQPAERQPRFVLLYCIDPGTDLGAQTVLIPISAVLDRLAKRTCKVLRETYEARVDGTPTILAQRASVDRFSFRDLGEETYLWDSPHSREYVEGALADLLTACYTSDQVYGSRWSRRDLIMIDNHRWFHGRTWSRTPKDVNTPRHLMRLRIREPRR